ncbi:SCO family protein [Granulicella mallensis]|uniref:Protein SCO1/2 n=1 Tax=Granulicella mallensis TaxID=940614 RepID=A0A7W8EBD9_9BACT|nr:SCO family protein [Granulicella mallensis]MBB5065479.1 protein SCO1/2 [Granulicella mallensis]
MRLRSTLLALVAAMTLALGSLVTGCHSTAKPSSVATKHYPIRGVVVELDATNKSVLLKHESIPGFMEAMTMAYRLSDPTVMSELHPGDKITATLVTDEDADGPTNMRLTDIVVIAQARPDYKPTVQYHEPAPGDSVPDFALLNQSDKKISLKQFRGKVLLMTFIYTRCPLADYCPRLSRNFAEIDKSLSTDAAVYGKTHLLSISFDPTYDTPKVLRSYGGAYTGRYTQEQFGHWDFAAPTTDEMEKMEQFFGLGVTPGDNGTLQHSLSTLVIGKDGKVVAFYPTNDWTTDEVIAQIRKAATA